MYSIELEKSFLASAKKLPRRIKEELKGNLTILEGNPIHPHLRLKALHGPLVGFYSFRVKDYRVIVEFLKGKKIKVLDIDRRDKIYKKNWR